MVTGSGLMSNLGFAKLIAFSRTPVSHAVEVGAHSVRYCNLGHYLLDPKVRVQLFEAQPSLAAALDIDTQAAAHIKVHTVAIGKENGTCTLLLYGAGTHIKGLVAPEIANAKTSRSGKQWAKKKIQEMTVPCHTFDRYDDGTIDIITLDSEGAEWWAIERMRSRPAWMCIEMGDDKNPYKNPFTEEIHQWMGDNGYSQHGTLLDRDAVFKRNDV